ncbi:MAG TPA: polysaccharide biosynthesis/export family protein [Vicinamibacterales bacterium]|jgi:polysaccharide export outer membrane protein
MRKRTWTLASAIGLASVGLLLPAPLVAQAPAAHAPAASASTAAVPADYVIGPDDALSVVFWRDKDMSAEVTVRPDGKISLPLLNEVQAAGFTPEQLRTKIVEAASKYVEEPNATVVVKEIKSRKVFITGNVAKPASYPLVGEMNVLQLIAQSGGLLEYADSKNIVVMRTEGGKQQYFKVNYNDVIKQKNVAQNITLKPGDTVVVP